MLAPLSSQDDLLRDYIDSEETDSIETVTEATKFSEEDSNLDADDEGFFDRPAVSPESGALDLPDNVTLLSSYP
jgi:hypothetical protein